MPDRTVLTSVFSIGIRSVADVAGFSAFRISRSLFTDYSKPEYPRTAGRYFAELLKKLTFP